LRIFRKVPVGDPPPGDGHIGRVTVGVSEGFMAFALPYFYEPGAQELARTSRAEYGIRDLDLSD
jgi:hypothetical protein